MTVTFRDRREGRDERDHHGTGRSEPVTTFAAGVPTAGGQSETPFGKGIPVGRYKGVAIRAHWSVALVLALFASLLALSALPAMQKGEATAAYWSAGVIVSAVFLVTLLAHELAHALTARHFGMKVERITLWMLGGLTELGGEPPSPRAEALIAASGPLTSLAAGVVCLGAAILLPGPGLLIASLIWLAEINIILGVFNLLPGAPLDGGRLLRAFLWWRTKDRAEATRRAARSGRTLGLVLIGLGFFEVVAGQPAGLWLALVGWFIVGGAASESYAVNAEQLRGLTVDDLLTTPTTVAPDWWTVHEFLEQLTVSEAEQPVIPVVDLDGKLRGVLTISALERAHPAERDTLRLRDLAAPATATVALHTPVPDLLLSLHLRGGAAVVVDDGRPIGVFTDRELMRLVQLARLGWPEDGHRPDPIPDDGRAA